MSERIQIRYVKNDILADLETEVNGLLEEGWYPFLPLVKGFAFWVQPMSIDFWEVGLNTKKAAAMYEFGSEE